MNQDRSQNRSIDVREIPPGQRHPAVFGNFAALKPGESFVLTSDHDPKPLRKQFETRHAGEFSWDYLEQGPALWRVQIGRCG